MCVVTRAFCRWQMLDINCTAGHAILVMSARYGRMKVGRCVAKNYGYVGCSVDVVGHMASLCSGRPGCRFEVPDVTLKRLQPCPKDFASYLEINYVCVSGTLLVFISSVPVRSPLISFHPSLPASHPFLFSFLGSSPNPVKRPEEQCKLLQQVTADPTAFSTSYIVLPTQSQAER